MKMEHIIVMQEAQWLSPSFGFAVCLNVWRTGETNNTVSQKCQISNYSVGISQPTVVCHRCLTRLLQWVPEGRLDDLETTRAPQAATCPNHCLLPTSSGDPPVSSEYSSKCTATPSLLIYPGYLPIWFMTVLIISPQPYPVEPPLTLLVPSSLSSPPPYTPWPPQTSTISVALQHTDLLVTATSWSWYGSQ